MFAERYLQKNEVEARIHDLPKPDTGIIVVIPCLREPEILATLDSLLNCSPTQNPVEVIVLVNHSEDAENSTKTYNMQTYSEIAEWIRNNQNRKIRFFVIGPEELRKKWAGAGLARKKGMDEAVRRFSFLKNPQGIIVSLDADTLVDANYLQEIEQYFLNRPKYIGATIAFQHRLNGLDAKHREGILLYEKYLHYYKLAMEYTGYPYSLFTVGSAFAVRAGAYVKRGGMNRRQAGEDFYFLQNLVQIGKVGEITATVVHPSARLSDRVPFGTGPILQKWMKGEENLNLTYSFEAFRMLHLFFNRINELYDTAPVEYQKLLTDLPHPVSRFLLEDRFLTEVDELKANCASPEAFRIRFFQKFNAFRILKYLNFVHERFFEKVPLSVQMELLQNAWD